MTSPTAEDWTVVGNDLRKTMGLPMYEGDPAIPSDEILAEYDKIAPGASDILRDMAVRQAEHRQFLQLFQSKDQLSRREVAAMVIASLGWLVCLSIIAFSYL